MKRRGKSKRFVMLEHKMLHSDAFNALSSSAVRVLISIMSCKTMDNGTSSKPIRCDYSTMNGCLDKRTIAKSIRELESIGFIEVVQRGGLYKQPNLYAISSEWINYRGKVPSG